MGAVTQRGRGRGPARRGGRGAPKMAAAAAAAVVRAAGAAEGAGRAVSAATAIPVPPPGPAAGPRRYSLLAIVGGGCHRPGLLAAALQQLERGEPAGRPRWSRCCPGVGARGTGPHPCMMLWALPFSCTASPVVPPPGSAHTGATPGSDTPPRRSPGSDTPPPPDSPGSPPPAPGLQDLDPQALLPPQPQIPQDLSPRICPLSCPRPPGSAPQDVPPLLPQTPRICLIPCPRPSGSVPPPQVLLPPMTCPPGP